MTTTFAGAIGAAIPVPAGITASVTTNSGGPTPVTLTADTYDSMEDLLTEFVAVLTATRPVTAGAWTAAATFMDAGSTPQLTIGVTAGTFSITWSSTDLRDLLGFTANISAQTSATGAGSMRGVWQPNCPLVPDARHRSAPPMTDARRARGPTGVVTMHVGNSRYKHSNLRYSHIPADKIWRVDEVVANESLQQFLDDTQWGAGHAWFGVGSKCRIWTSDGYQLGEDDAVVNWWPEGFTGLGELVTRVDGWDGLWSCAFPAVSSDGT